MEANTGYVVASYAITVLALGGYLLRLHARGRAARRAADAVARRRR
ncbi:MAG: heme exporter protein CcmD [Actinomycetota bacterium]|jgi:hypothetical protein